MKFYADENDEIEINLVQDRLPPVKLLEPQLEDIPSFRVPVVHYICQNCSLSYKKEKFYNQHLEKCKVGGVGGGMRLKKKDKGRVLFVRLMFVF